MVEERRVITTRRPEPLPTRHRSLTSSSWRPLRQSSSNRSAIELFETVGASLGNNSQVYCGPCCAKLFSSVGPVDQQSRLLKLAVGFLESSASKENVTTLLIPGQAHLIYDGEWLPIGHVRGETFRKTR